MSAVTPSPLRSIAFTCEYYLGGIAQRLHQAATLHPHRMNRLLKRRQVGAFIERFDRISSREWNGASWSPAFQEYALRMDWHEYVSAVERKASRNLDRRNYYLIWFIQMIDRLGPFEAEEFLVPGDVPKRRRAQTRETGRARRDHQILLARQRAIELLGDPVLRDLERGEPVPKRKKVESRIVGAHDP